MDPEKFKDKTKKVAGTTEIGIVSVDYLNPEYEIEVLSNQRTTPTGLLEVIRLNPRKSDLPRFIFRWDENNDELDVDIYKEGKLFNKLWNEPKYSGHHTKRIVEQSEVFKADISIPNKEIFRGEIDVGLFIQIIIKDSGKFTDNIKVVHNIIKIEDSGKGYDNVTVNKKSKN